MGTNNPAWDEAMAAALKKRAAVTPPSQVNTAALKAPVSLRTLELPALTERRELGARQGDIELPNESGQVDLRLQSVEAISAAINKLLGAQR